jgi:glyceraldehyde-3-phosphate dehydrogenase (ferredoxin)
MLTANERLFSFNYQSIYQDDEARLNQHQNLILNHYLRQFNEEIIEPKNFKHCGEPCAVACKKMDRRFKKDYEPYQALGPLCGVFDQRAAEELNHYVDAMGFDSIQTGGTLSWIMELVYRGIIEPKEFGLPPADALVFDFRESTDSFDVKVDSARNASYARALVDMLLFETTGEIFRHGIRAAAKALDERLGLHNPGQRTVDYAVYTAHGDEGCMVPNQYWVPGMFSPMPMMGKYFNYYGVDFLPPRELGKKCVERMVYEFYSENSGICRFHRKWCEAIVDEIIASHYDVTLDFKAHQFATVKAICNQEIDGIVFWESERTVDIIQRYLENWERQGLNEPELHEWIERFWSDKMTAARDYWEEVRIGIVSALAAGPELIPDNHPTHKAAALDVMEERE